MDSHYIINRLKTAQYKYPTAQVLRKRLINLGEKEQFEIVTKLKKQVYIERNADIQQPLVLLLHKLPMAS